MKKGEINIDEQDHRPALKTTDRLKHSLLSVLFGFLLVNIIAFWMFPGLGLGGFYMFSSAHSLVSAVADLTNVIIIAFLAICATVGWFQGRYFTDRLKGFIHFWKFW